MIFYKNLFISVILSAFLILAMIAYMVYVTKKKQAYPPVFQACPDYYILDAQTGICSANEDVWKVNALPSKSVRTNMYCNNVDFSSNKKLGMGADSSLCNKKNWSADCGVSWDGISNNPDICYTNYVQPA